MPYSFATDPFTSATYRGAALGHRTLRGRAFLLPGRPARLGPRRPRHDGDVKQVYEYGPYGEVSKDAGTNPSPIRFAGEYVDQPSRLYKIGQRYYDPQIGRWTQRDPVLQPFSLVGSNAYAYAGASPVNIVDPSGRTHEGYAPPAVRVLVTVGHILYIGASTYADAELCVASLRTGPAAPAVCGAGIVGSGYVYHTLTQFGAFDQSCIDPTLLDPFS